MNTDSVENKMLLEINDRYRLTSDPMNVILQERRGKGWKNLGYFATLYGALNFLVDHSIRVSDARIAQELVADINAIGADIREALEAFQNVKPWKPDEVDAEKLRKRFADWAKEAA